MKRALLVTTLALTACKAPTAPTQEPVQLIAPLHDNIPATFAGHPEGPVVWLCATQPRPYVTADGQTHLEEDHYLQYEPCPAERVK